MINRVVLIGRLTRDPEMRYTSNEKPWTTFGLAVERQFRNQQGERETDFFNVTAWGKVAELVKQYLGKGRLVGIDGRIQQRKYTARDGTERTTFDIIADNVQFLDRAGDTGGGGGGGSRQPASSDSGGSDAPPPPEMDDVMDDGDLPF